MPWLIGGALLSILTVFVWDSFRFRGTDEEFRRRRERLMDELDLHDEPH